MKNKFLPKFIGGVKCVTDKQQTIDADPVQLMLTNPLDAYRSQSRSPNMVRVDMLGMVSY